MINEYKKICDQVDAVLALNSLLPSFYGEPDKREKQIIKKIDDIIDDIIKPSKCEDLSILQTFVDYATEKRSYDKQDLQETLDLFLAYLEKERT